MRTLDLLLIAIIAVGAYFYWNASPRFRDLHRDRQARAAKIGEFDVGHEKGVRLLTEVGEDKKRFSWQLFVGTDVSGLCTYGVNVGVSQSSCSNSDVIIEVEFHEGSDRTQVSISRRSIRFGANGSIGTGGGSGGSGFASGAMHRFFNQHWQDLEFSVFHADGHEPQDLKTPIRLLSIRVPDELAEEFRATWNDSYSYAMQFHQDRDTQVIFQLNVAETLPAEVQKRMQKTRAEIQKRRQSSRERFEKLRLENKQGRGPFRGFDKPQGQ